MNTRVGKRKRRVAEAEATLAIHRRALRAQLHALATDARAAATPGRIVVGGLATGFLVGLLTGRRRRAKRDAPAPTSSPGLLQSLTGMVRLASLVMPLLAPLLAMTQGTSPGSATPPQDTGASAPPAGDPLA